MKFLEKLKHKNRFSLFEPFVILAFWVLLFASPIILEESSESLNWDHIAMVWANFVPYLILFLINRYILLPYLFFKNKRGLFILSVVVLIFGMSVVDYFGKDQLITPRPEMNESRPQHRRPEFMPPPPDGGPRGQMNGERPGRPPLRPKELPPFISFIVISFLVVGFDTALVLSVKWVSSEQRRMAAETENVQNQLAFLRNQVSPHFFMNTLNNIHSLIDVDTEEAKESIIRLSKLMRHLLYDTEVERIPIKKEIEFIETYMDLMKMRYSDKIRINLRILKDIPDKLIPPLLFTSYVENAFKHGISYQNESFVEVVFSFTENNLIFNVKNSKPKIKQEQDNSGIGIANSRKRLDLIYGDKFSLQVEDLQEEFNINLIIPL